MRILHNRMVFFGVAIIFIFLAGLYNLLQKNPPSIGLVGVPQIINPQKDDIYSIRSLFTQIAPIEYINWTDAKKNAITPKINTLIFFGTNTPISQSEEKEIDHFVQNGGSAIFMVDGIYIPQGSKPVPSSHNLFNLFKKYGIELQNDMVISQSNATASISTNQTSFASPYPVWVKTTNFNKSAPEFTTITSLIFPWSSSINMVQSANAKTTVIVRSENNSWIQKGQFNIAPNEIPIASKNQQTTYNLIVQATTRSGGHLLVIPSSRFVREQFLSIPAENVTFLGNVVRQYIKTTHVLSTLLVVGTALAVFLAYYLWRIMRVRQ